MSIDNIKCLKKSQLGVTATDATLDYVRRIDRPLPKLNPNYAQAADSNNNFSGRYSRDYFLGCSGFATQNNTADVIQFSNRKIIITTFKITFLFFFF